MSALLELAERCEEATVPDRELSAEIALAVYDWLHEVEGNKPLNCRVRNSFGSPVYIGGATAASVGRNAKRQDREAGLGPKGEHAVVSEASETPNHLPGPPE